jgi:hypothetical protein
LQGRKIKPSRHTTKCWYKTPQVFHPVNQGKCIWRKSASRSAGRGSTIKLKTGFCWFSLLHLPPPESTTVCRRLGLNQGVLRKWHRQSDNLVLTQLELIHSQLDLIHSQLDLIHSQLDLIHSQLDLIHYYQIAHLVLLGPAEEDPEGVGGGWVGGGGGGGPLAPSFFTPSAGTSTHLQHTNQFMYLKIWRQLRIWWHRLIYLIM